MRFVYRRTSAEFLCLLIATCMTTVAAEPNAIALRNTYQSEIRPLLESYCFDCHGAADFVEGDVNLAAMTSLDEVVKHPQTWQKVAEMLGNGLMPPEDAEQPTADERVRLERWVGDYLSMEARAHAGDPGRVILRRLSNAEYTYTLRDLTGVELLDPAREFPADGAAGEGFTNTGGALVMSPTMVTKYLDAAKEVASHAVLLPDGFRFSPHTTPRDWTDAVLAQIRQLYSEFTDAAGGSQVNLQGIVFETNQGGRLPLEKYLAAVLIEREALATGRKTIDAAAREHALNAKYLRILWAALTKVEPSLLLDDIRAKWREAKPEDAAALAADVAAWQQSLWSFSSVGLIGRSGGPKRWMEPVDPLTTKHEIRYKIPPATADDQITISLLATPASDGNNGDFVVWQKPRLVSAGRPDLLLRDVRSAAYELESRRTRIFAQTAAYLNAADELTSSSEPLDIAKLAVKHRVEEAALRAWLGYLGISTGNPAQVEGLFRDNLNAIGGYEFINGWGSADTPLLAANSSDEHVRIPGNVEPHSVVVHPSPTARAAVGWRSPMAATVRIEAAVVHAHPECGNGVTWALELRRDASRQRLAEGAVQGAAAAQVGPLDGVIVRPGDVVALSIGPREGDHSCDLTAIDLKIVEEGTNRTWNLDQDVSNDVLFSNPHADRFGNASVWHFYADPDVGVVTENVIPPDSLLGKWKAAKARKDRQALALDVQKLLTGSPPAANDSPDAMLYRQLAAMRGPLLCGVRAPTVDTDITNTKDSDVGPNPEMFGRHPNGRAMDPADLCVHAPSAIAFRLPADLAADCELVTSGVLDSETGAEGSVQLAVVAGEPAVESSLLHGETTITVDAGVSWSGNKRVGNSAPIVVTKGSATQRRVKAAFEEFRQLFPLALCYTKIVPVDEVISVTLFYREDDHLVRLMLDDAQRERLDRLWDELHFISGDALTSVDAFAQLLEFASQDADPKVFEPLRQPINDRAAAFRQRLLDCEPKQVDALIDFAARAYRRPLSTEESGELRGLYAKLRGDEIPHEEAFRLTLARVLVAPAFLYRIEKPLSGAEQGPVTDWELASRLSYFLWASQPDDELRTVAAAGRLRDPEQLVAQMRRMLRDAKTRRLATEFACHWLQIDGFEHLDEKSERHFPTFTSLRGAMAEESIQFFTDLFRQNGSVLDILDADYTFLNEDLARHYGIPGVMGAQWRRVDGVKEFSRGGVLAQATTLAKQSGASRTSPILRGAWISEVLLGERLPKPPPGVPPLPDDEAASEGLTVRQLVEKHTSEPSCAVCHRRIDPYGISLEAFDAIGRLRDKDLGDRPIDTRVTVMDGAEFEGLNGLRNYLLTTRRDAFLRQFCRKLLGYALGRTVQLSDDPLLAEMQRELAARDYKVEAGVESVVRSRQFREIRGREAAVEE
jgi:Protein of unknown function (DUF1592)/Protein of unknown function (DUF1588)/Protein of unknown function (DUF1587)/Protein of unknown function (DUF1585)/Protein of unknown function (DUF1595)